MLLSSVLKCSVIGRLLPTISLCRFSTKKPNGHSEANPKTDKTHQHQPKPKEDNKTNAKANGQTKAQEEAHTKKEAETKQQEKVEEMNEEAKKDYIHKYTKLHASVTEKGKKVAALQAETQLDTYQAGSPRGILSKLSIFRTFVRTQNTEVKKRHDKIHKEIQDTRAEIEKKLADGEKAWATTKKNIENIKLEGASNFGKDLIAVNEKLEGLQKLAKEDTPQQLKVAIDMTSKILVKILAKNSVNQIDPTVNQKFDPKEHVKAGQVEGHKQKGVVVEVQQKGWKVYDKVIKPAKVIVSK